MSDLPVLDSAPLQELIDMGAEASLVQELVLLFQEDVPPRLVRLAASLASGDGPGILVEAHQLKGATGNLGLMRFSELAGRIETLVRQQQLQAAEPLIQALQGVYDEGLAALTQAFPAS
jgi:HPt (histidine-containing phosphotransfer) domain-containing protein